MTLRQPELSEAVGRLGPVSRAAHGEHDFIPVELAPERVAAEIARGGVF